MKGLRQEKSNLVDKRKFQEGKSIQKDIQDLENLDKKHQELIKDQSSLYKGLQDIWRLQNLKK